MDYISKYLKYKNKYIYLKNKINLQSGGSSESLNLLPNATSGGSSESLNLLPNATSGGSSESLNLSPNATSGFEESTIKTNSKNFDKFIQWYIKQEINKKSSLDILYSLYKYPQLELGLKIYNNPRNILVGCTNKDINDYLRFKDNNYYSLYVNSSNELTFDSGRQYYMYTINKEQLFEIHDSLKYKGTTSRYKLEFLPQNMIDNIHFDLYTSYFCSSTEYFKLATHLLKNNGIMSFNLYGAHDSILYNYNESTNTFRKGILYKESDPIFSLDDLQHEFNVIIDPNKKEIRLNRLAYRRCVNGNANTLSPQPFLGILYDDHINKKRNYFNFIPNHDEYIDYLRTKYTIDFTFEKLMYTFKNYTYPVPIRIDNRNRISLYDEPEAIIIFNTIMSSHERQAYLKDKIISEELIDILAERILQNPEYSTHFLEENTSKTLTKESITIKINSILSKPQYYINATRIFMK